MQGRNTTKRRVMRLGLVCAGLLLTAACASTSGEKLQTVASTSTIDPGQLNFAISEVKKLQSKGARVWCVPFARNASGVQLRGNAETWWGKAAGVYPRDKTPEVGDVMAFSGTRKLPMGHVAVVSRVISEREILVDHANWKRNQVSLGMPVMDISDNNDWSRVRVMSEPGSYGSAYPVDGFITPLPDREDQLAAALQTAAPRITE